MYRIFRRTMRYTSGGIAIGSLLWFIFTGNLASIFITFIIFALSSVVWFIYRKDY